MSINRTDITVASAASLTAELAAELQNGCWAWCILERQYFVLEKTSGATANNTSILAPQSGSPIAGNAGARWILANIFGSGVPGANLQAVWFVDPTNGSDSNDGLTTSTALKTLQENARRIGTQTITIPVVVTLMGSTGPTDQPQYQLNLTGAGMFKLVAAASALTSIQTGTLTAKTDWSGNTAADITDSALPAANFWTAQITHGRRVRITSGTHTGAIAWVLKDLGAKQARMSNWMVPDSLSPTFLLATVNLTVGDAYVVESVPSIDNISFVIAYPDTSAFVATVVIQDLWLKNHHFQTTGSVHDGAGFYSCDMGTELSPIGGWALVDCRLPTNFFLDARSEIDLYAGTCIGNIEFGAGLANIDLGFVVQGGFAQFFGGEGIIAQLGVYDSATAGVEFFSEGGWTVEAFFATTKLWGSGNGTYGFRVHNSAVVTFDTFAGCTITGTTSDLGIGPNGGTVNKIWANAPVGICDVAAGLFTTMSGVVKV